MSYGTYPSNGKIMIKLFFVVFAISIHVYRHVSCKSFTDYSSTFSDEMRSSSMFLAVASHFLSHKFSMSLFCCK